jgi:cation diffusion facilitator CzcD-associated flavoprotein CzcO
MTNTNDQAPVRQALTGSVDAVIVGAGFAGLCALHRLRNLDLSVAVFEAGGGVGGTWYWNRYPGARCDVESVAYSYSFSPELDQEWDWSERYPSQPEVLSYLEHVADKFDLRKDIRFGTRVEQATYDEASARWHISTDRGDELEARYCLMAVGSLSEPKVPDIDGWERFEGERYFTARWPHEPVTFVGKRVAVIGTGSSGVQCIPVIAQEAGHLTVFQRTPAFSMPARNAPISEERRREIKAEYPSFREEVRNSPFGHAGAVAPTQSALDADPTERTQTYETAWIGGRMLDLLSAYTDLMTSRDANETAAEFMREKIRSVVTDPKVAEALCPTTYPIGTKRPVLDTNYYETFNRDNVTLVNLTETPIVEITDRGIKTTDVEHQFDAIVFAVGFDALTGPLLAIDIRGRGGASLKSKWSEGPMSYLGVASAGFPNLFTIAGPLSPSVRGNVVVNIEQHVDWVARLIEFMEREGLVLVEPEQDAEDEWFELVQQMANVTLLPHANSWYIGANIPGKPRVYMVYVGGVGQFRKLCDEVAEKGYAGFSLA